MRKLREFSRCLVVLGVVVAMFAANAQAEVISITIEANGVTIPVDPLTTGGTPQNYGTVDITTLNTLLTAAGSAYQFSALGGSSNWSGAPAGGILQLSGGIFIPAGAVGSTSLTITQTEDGFISPSGPHGTVSSASTGTFNDAGPGNSHDANSSFNAITTPTYTVASTSTGPDPQGNMSAADIPTFVTPYTLSNFISFALAPGASSSPQDSFGVTVKALAIPEPASSTIMLIGLPVAIVFSITRCRKLAERR
jgi:hypothetical protein